MARPKGGVNRRWTNEERLKYVLLHEEGKMTRPEICKVYGVPNGTLRGWIDRYRKGGESALNPEKMRSGNRFAALHSSKSLNKEEKLTLLVEKLKIENERLKKGYVVKGVGAKKEFVTIKDLNSK